MELDIGSVDVVVVEVGFGTVVDVGTDFDLVGRSGWIVEVFSVCMMRNVADGSV